MRLDRRRFDPIHLLAYVLLALMFTYAQHTTNVEADRACQNTNALRNEIRFVLDTQLSDRELLKLRRHAKANGIPLFKDREC